jgi:uncharacterized protein
MAVGSLLALLDDISTMLDDVSVMTQIAAKKTAGVLGDDLALNAQQVSGVAAERELPVVWAVAKGSFLNKLILVPVALTMSYFVPWFIIPLMMLGGAYLCFEGFEKLAHKLLHPKANTHQHQIKQALENPNADLVVLEKDKIKGAIRTDFILSAEIIVIALGTVAEADFLKQITVVSLIAIVMTAGVYGLVAGIVKLDDIGLHLMLKQGQNIYRQMIRKIGYWLLNFTPYLMRTLTILGTAAMFLVGGGIIGHNTQAIHQLSEHVTSYLQQLNTFGSMLSNISPLLFDLATGLLVGAISVTTFEILKRMLQKNASAN